MTKYIYINAIDRTVTEFECKPNELDIYSLISIDGFINKPYVEAGWIDNKTMICVDDNGMNRANKHVRDNGIHYPHFILNGTVIIGHAVIIGGVDHNNYAKAAKISVEEIMSGIEFMDDDAVDSIKEYAKKHSFSV